MVPFKGRNSLKQYMRNKPQKWGIKVFARCGTSGILYDFEVYVGKGTTVYSSLKLGISRDIVIRLVSKLPKNQNFKLHIDYWFTSHSLLCALKEIGIYGTGTVRSRLPCCILKRDSMLKNDGRGRCDIRTETKNNITVVKWYGNKPIHVASAYVYKNQVSTVKGWSVAEKTNILICLQS
ncbi:piggyBac transposable element-derived protein 3-like [Lepeophtheirus salmonis]|uniref:piggyBac transposable element-derived protein 3-like n=1 Tax=Lepeophtheirus salmonis TaxID=72036 RepID=UPI003AF3A12D